MFDRACSSGTCFGNRFPRLQSWFWCGGTVWRQWWVLLLLLKRSTRSLLNGKFALSTAIHWALRAQYHSGFPVGSWRLAQALTHSPFSLFVCAPVLFWKGIYGHRVKWKWQETYLYVAPKEDVEYSAVRRHLSQPLAGTPQFQIDINKLDFLQSWTTSSVWFFLTHKCGYINKRFLNLIILEKWWNTSRILRLFNHICVRLLLVGCV